MKIDLKHAKDEFLNGAGVKIVVFWEKEWDSDEYYYMEITVY